MKTTKSLTHEEIKELGGIEFEKGMEKLSNEELGKKNRRERRSNYTLHCNV